MFARASNILKFQEPFLELRDSFTNVSLLPEHKVIIKIILKDTLSEVLTGNELKEVFFPYNNAIFNSYKRFQNTLQCRIF